MKHFSILSFFLFIVTISFAQNVGIGTTVPQTLLHVNSISGNSIIRSETNIAAAQAGLELKTGANPFDFLELRKWISGSTGTVAGISLNGLSTITTGNNTNAGLLIGTKPAQPIYFTTNTIERMRIDEAGNIGIGTVPVSTNKLSVVTADGNTAIEAKNNRILPPGSGYISSIMGLVSNNSLNGAGVVGQATTALGSTSQIVPGMYGVIGTAIEQGYGIGAFGVGGAGGIYAKVILGSGIALRTFGPLLLEGIGAAPGSVLTSDAVGNATWQSLAGSHNHFGEYWTGNSNFSGLTVKNTSPLTGGIGIFGISEGPGFGIEGLSTNDLGIGIVGSVSHGEPGYPSIETNSGVAANNTTGNGLYATSYTGYAIKAHKQNSSSPVTGPVVLFLNAKTTNTSPVLVIQNAASNPTALELNNGYIKVSGTNKMAFVHTTNAGNITSNTSTLSYPNAAATDMLFVTHNYSPVNTYFNYNYGVYWTGAAWAIFIEKNSILDPSIPMSVNINFNVMVIKQ